MWQIFAANGNIENVLLVLGMVLHEVLEPQLLEKNILACFKGNIVD